MTHSGHLRKRTIPTRRTFGNLRLLFEDRIRGRWCVSSASPGGPLDSTTLAAADHLIGSYARWRVTHARKKPMRSFPTRVEKDRLALWRMSKVPHTPQLRPAPLWLTRGAACFAPREPFSRSRQSVCPRSECRRVLAPSWHHPQADRFWMEGGDSLMEGGDSFLCPSYEYALTAVSLPAASAPLDRCVDCLPF
jgi:hypothetical protein